MIKWYKERRKVKNILEQLDACAKEFTFPMLDNGYVYLIDSKMSILSSSDYWCIIIEIIGFSTRGGGHDGINNAVHVFGDFPTCKPGLQNENFFYFTENVDGVSAFEEEYHFYLNPQANGLMINGIEYELVHNRDRYLEANISVEDKEQIGIQDFLRLIWPRVHKKPFLKSEDLLKLTHNSLKLMIQLKDWQHPDLANDELPSDTHTFIEIANAFARSNFDSLEDLSNKGNTNWRNWPEGGSL
ncbi:DUF7003 family protein [Lewinella cohaerens]|uniref:DUF7003 family protein n=1 Tax=Lewinella cohaerens TaxID=70995 RepID=UPI0003616163|nr:hypothetical protein [Lewinella cohaerens]